MVLASGEKAARWGGRQKEPPLLPIGLYRDAVVNKKNPITAAVLSC